MAARDHTASAAPVSGRQRLSDQQRLDWLRLIRGENVGPVTFRDLINHFGDARAALEALPEGPELPGTFETGPETPLETDVDPSDRERVVESLGPAPVDVDELIRATGLPAQQVHIILLELDLAGRIERHGRQLVSLKDAGEP